MLYVLLMGAEREREREREREKEKRRCLDKSFSLKAAELLESYYSNSDPSARQEENY